MKALIDGDILRYEIGFAAETGWKAITERDEPPPFDYVNDLLNQRIANILAVTQADSYCLYLTEGKTFRDTIGVTKPYKGHRVSNKPWHYNNLTAIMEGLHPVSITKGIEADDAMAMASNGKTTIVCSRDKDLRQVPGLFYSWELGNQPSFGPILIDPIGNLTLSDDKKKLSGTGYAFFCGQLLVGDRVDNIPGCMGVGPVKAYDILSPVLKEENGFKKDFQSLLDQVEIQYEETYGLDKSEQMLLEQGQLLWIVRRYNPDGTPEMWRRDLYV